MYLQNTSSPLQALTTSRRDQVIYFSKNTSYLNLLTRKYRISMWQGSCLNHQVKCDLIITLSFSSKLEKNMHIVLCDDLRMTLTLSELLSAKQGCFVLFYLVLVVVVALGIEASGPYTEPYPQPFYFHSLINFETGSYQVAQAGLQPSILLPPPVVATIPCSRRTSRSIDF